MIKLLSAHGAVEHVFPEPPADGDPYALAIVIAIALVFTVWILIRNKKMKAAPAEEPAAVEIPKGELPKAPGSAGQLKLHNVEPKTAAMVMAIVADKMGKPLNELRFISIKEVE